MIAIQGSAPERLVLLPTGAGAARPLKNGPITDYYGVEWLPDGKQIIFGAIEPGQPFRQYIQDTEGGYPRPTMLGGKYNSRCFYPTVSLTSHAGLEESATSSTQKVVTLVRCQVLPEPIM